MTVEITPALIANACGATVANATKYASALVAACARFQINTPERVAAFLAQVSVECGSLSVTSESFDYSIPRLMAMFPRTMPYALAVKYGRQPFEHAVPVARQEQIANIVYANQYGNGGSASGDGWLYRGGGLLQISFKSNYDEAGVGLGINLVANPDLVRTDPETGANAAGRFWSTRGLNQLADDAQFDTITRRINPGMADLPQRLAAWSRAKAALHIS